MRRSFLAPLHALKLRTGMLVLCCLTRLAGPAAAVASAGAALAGDLPKGVAAALARAQVPAGAVSVVVQEAGAPQHALLTHNADVPRNPASVMKLVTTQAALELLGPAWTWKTPVYTDGPIQDGVLRGSLYLQGQGDPQLVVERLWLLLRRVQGLGIRKVQGDIVLDHGAMEITPQDPSDFDGEPLRPYNAAPDALLINYKSVVMTFTPDRTARVVRLSVEPPLAGVNWPLQVPMRDGPCGDYRAALRPDFSDPLHPQFVGGYAGDCGEKVWPLAYADPASYAVRAVEAMWRGLGGEIGGHVRDGQVPEGLNPAFAIESPPLVEIIRNINKYSNNVMAQQLFLTLGLQQLGTGSRAASRAVIERWWLEQIGPRTGAPPAVANGAGLSREDRISAAALAGLLQHAWRSPFMPELFSALPIAGVDGTLRPQRWHAQASAHLKTGSLRDVSSIAGVIQAHDGRRYVIAAMINHPSASAARPALEALVDWVAQQGTTIAP